MRLPNRSARPARTRAAQLATTLAGTLAATALAAGLTAAPQQALQADDPVTTPVEDNLDGRHWGWE